MKFYMLVLALDTTTRRGSAALLRDGALLDSEIGDAARTYGERLPGDLIRLLERQRLRIQDIELFAVAAGPGSLTGMRIGIATMQGFAMANGRRMVGVSTLDALARTGKRGRVPFSSDGPKKAPDPFFGAWLDAQRGEVYSALYRDGTLADGPAAEKPAVALSRWSSLVGSNEVVFVGDGALTYRSAIASAFPDASIATEVPALAPAVGELATEAAARNESVEPGAVRPIYVRRPDVELARDRRAAEPSRP